MALPREKLVLLVGSNPLPNYLTACALRPKQVALVHSGQTKAAAERLVAALKKALPEASFGYTPLSSATDADKVRQHLTSQLGADWHLNYTGGTKVMAAQARLVFAGGNEAASYLDEGGKGVPPRLRFDDGTEKELADFGAAIDLETLLRLHAIELKNGRSDSPNGPIPDDIDRILEAVLHEPELAKRLYCEGKRMKDGRLEELRERPFRPADFGLTLSASAVPERHTKPEVKAWGEFVGGIWLEPWTGARVRELTGLDPVVNCVASRAGAEFEVDVALVRGCRSYFISCTTDARKYLCKSKLLEIAVRSRQLGGDLARAALVCLADDPTTAALAAEIRDVWGATNTTKVFGLSDIRAWAGRNGPPNLASLREWLGN